MKIKAFKGLRPTKDKAADIASLPYDVVNYEQAVEQPKATAELHGASFALK